MRHLLLSYVNYYNTVRTHLFAGKGLFCCAPCACSRTHPTTVRSWWIASSIYPDLINGRDRPQECLRLISAEPVRRLVHDPAPDHRHQGFDVANANFLHGERVGAQDREVRKLAGLQRALSALVEGQERVVVRRAAQRLDASERLLGRHALIRDAVLAGDRLPNGRKH